MSDLERRVIRVGSYSRTVPLKRVTFSCKWCGRSGERVQYPGRQPQYHTECAPLAARLAARLRQREHRHK